MFKHGLTVRTIRRRVRVPGYIDLESQRVQQLGFRLFGFFVVIDEEIVPADIDISLCCFGDMGRSWTSKFAAWI